MEMFVSHGSIFCGSEECRKRVKELLCYGKWVKEIWCYKRNVCICEGVFRVSSLDQITWSSISFISPFLVSSLNLCSAYLNFQLNLKISLFFFKDFQNSLEFPWLHPTFLEFPFQKYPWHHIECTSSFLQHNILFQKANGKYLQLHCSTFST